MTDKGKIFYIALIILAGCFAYPQMGFGQDSSSGTTLKQPRNNVTNGAISARRPGLWIGTARTNHSERQQKAVRQFGGATYTQTESDVKPSFGKSMYLALVQGMGDFVATLSDAFMLALDINQANQVTPVEQPVVVE